MNYLEIVGTLVGLLYLWFEYKASIWLWPVSVIMPAIYIVVYYQVGLYADSGISVYYLLAGIYGWWVWLRHVPGGGALQAQGAVPGGQAAAPTPAGWHPPPRIPVPARCKA